MSSLDDEVTRILEGYRGGNREVLDELLPLVYDELRRIAARYLRSERPNHTLQPTALVHEAYMRLAGQREVQWQNRAHFYGVAAQIMRRLLVSHAREHKADKRGGQEVKIPIDEALDAAVEREVDLVTLDQALIRLAVFDEQASKIVELRYFGGLSIEETAEVLDVSPATVKRDWAMARGWLHKQIFGEPG